MLLDFQEQVGEACAEESNEEEAQFVNFATCGCVPTFGAGAGAAAVGEPLGAEADEEPGSELEAVSMDEGEPLLLEVESLPAGEILGGREHQLVLCPAIVGADETPAILEDAVVSTAALPMSARKEVVSSEGARERTASARCPTSRCLASRVRRPGE